MKTKSDIPEPKFLSVPESARICGVSRNTVYMWVRQKKLSAYQTPGRTNLIRPGDLVEFMQDNGMFIPTSLLQMAQADQQSMEGGRPAPASAADISPGQREILVVDDDPMSRTVAVRALNAIAPISEAETGFEALHMLTLNEKITVVLLDLRMPGQHGIDSLKEMQKLNPNLTVIVVSGFAADLPEEEVVRQMVYRVVEKPVSIPELQRVVQDALKLGG